MTAEVPVKAWEKVVSVMSTVTVRKATIVKLTLAPRTFLRTRSAFMELMSVRQAMCVLSSITQVFRLAERSSLWTMTSRSHMPQLVREDSLGYTALRLSAKHQLSYESRMLLVQLTHGHTHVT